MTPINGILVALQILFLVTSFFIEREYCKGPLDPSSTKLLVKETVDFSVEYNPLFHARPEWLVQATCLSAYGLIWVFVAVLYTAATDQWSGSGVWSRVMVPLLLGFKANAIVFYHYMEFTSDTPPPSVLHYFASEGSYLVSMGLCFYQLVVAAKKATKDKGD